MDRLTPLATPIVNKRTIKMTHPESDAPNEDRWNFVLILAGVMVFLAIALSVTFHSVIYHSFVPG